MTDIFPRFSTPGCIVTDNAPQFISEAFKCFVDDLGIQINYASVSHPQSNGQVECANGMILKGLKPRFCDRLKPYAGKWVKELPAVLWGLRTNNSRATGQSQFSLVYESEAMLPTKVNIISTRVQAYAKEAYNNQCYMDLIAIEELQDRALIRAAKYQQSLCPHHDRNIKTRQFQVEDLVLHKILSTKDRHKLSLVWEGPFVVKETTHSGA